MAAIQPAIGSVTDRGLWRNTAPPARLRLSVLLQPCRTGAIPDAADRRGAGSAKRPARQGDDDHARDTFLVATEQSTARRARSPKPSPRRCSEHGLDVETLPAGTSRRLSRLAGVVLGGALYMGRWHPDAARVPPAASASALGDARRGLRDGPSDARPSTMSRRSRAQLVKALAKVPGGRSVRDRDLRRRHRSRSLRFPFNRMPASDARDWAAIRAWATRSPPRSTTGKPHPRRGITAASFSRRPDEDRAAAWRSWRTKGQSSQTETRPRREGD